AYPPGAVVKEFLARGQVADLLASDAAADTPICQASVAFVGTYGPRRCGIASFTGDLSRAVAAGGRPGSPMILAVTDPSGQYQYPAEVKFEVRQNIKPDYARAAEFVNYSDVRVVSIQHEYGI